MSVRLPIGCNNRLRPTAEIFAKNCFEGARETGRMVWSNLPEPYLVMVIVVVVALMPALIRHARVPGGVILGAIRMLIGLAVFRALPFVPVVVMIPITVTIANGNVAQIE